jgi:hypothetical protein
MLKNKLELIALANWFTKRLNKIGFWLRLEGQNQSSAHFLVIKS